MLTISYSFRLSEHKCNKIILSHFLTFLLPVFIRTISFFLFIFIIYVNKIFYIYIQKCNLFYLHF